jgi:adenine-specific DNA-methyltransferase
LERIGFLRTEKKGVLVLIKDSQVKEIESLVESITETVKLKTNSLSSSDIDFYDRKIKNLENQLDKLIYDLYGIEPDDIAIIQKNLI